MLPPGAGRVSANQDVAMYDADRSRGTPDASAAQTRADRHESDSLPGTVPGLVYSVTELNESVRALIAQRFPEVWVRGEISNLSRPGSGHAYFSLKDDTGQVRCAMFRGRIQRLKFKPENGLEVVVRATVGLYVQRGEFQLVVEEMDPAGTGALQARFEALKTKLAAEGLFDAAQKRELPKFPRCIGVVTSPTGAALRDILSVLARRAPGVDVIVYPCLVQGDSAAPSIVHALDAAYVRAESELLIVARGGGSLEDLWPFNEEAVARKLAEAPIPVVSGVGHETDFSIADMVADVRAPTPSAAAELCSRHLVALTGHLTYLTERLLLAGDRHLEGLRLRLGAATRALADPTRLLRVARRDVENLEHRLTLSLTRRLAQEQREASRLQQRLARNDPRRLVAQQQFVQVRVQKALIRAMGQRLRQSRDRLASTRARLEAVSPLATLNRGYAIVYDADGAAIRTPDAVDEHARIRIRVQHGAFDARRLPGDESAGEATGSPDPQPRIR